MVDIIKRDTHYNKLKALGLNKFCLSFLQMKGNSNHFVKKVRFRIIIMFNSGAKIGSIILYSILVIKFI